MRYVQRLREIIARHVTEAIPGAAGAISVTLLTGIATGIPLADHDAFRASGLAHLLAVAGLHIGIVMGWVTVFFRLASPRRNTPASTGQPRSWPRWRRWPRAAATWC